MEMTRKEFDKCLGENADKKESDRIWNMFQETLKMEKFLADRKIKVGYKEVKLTKTQRVRFALIVTGEGVESCEVYDILHHLGYRKDSTGTFGKLMYNMEWNVAKHITNESQIISERLGL